MLDEFNDNYNYRYNSKCFVINWNDHVPLLVSSLNLKDISTLIESKLSGFPYLPKQKSYPKDIHGNYMNLLAQINFSELQI